jgi:acyl carrier protein
VNYQVEGMRNALYEIFVAEIGLRPEDFTDDLSYNSVPEWDSQAHILIVMAIEEKFNISLESDDVIRMTSVCKIMDILKGRGVSG